MFEQYGYGYDSFDSACDASSLCDYYRSTCNTFGILSYVILIYPPVMAFLIILLLWYILFKVQALKNLALTATASTSGAPPQGDTENASVVP